MSAKISDFLGVNYGWSYGEDNWNTGMDTNLLQFSYLHEATIKGVVSTLPSMVSGDAYFNTSDNKVYFCVNSVVYSTEIPINKTLYDTVAQIQYVFNGTTATAVSYITQSAADARYILQTSAGTTGSQVLAANTPAAGRTALGLGTASTQPSSAFEPAITSGSTTQYIRGDKTLSTFNTDVIAAPLTGLSTATSTVITASDTVLTAPGKLQAQVTLRAPSASPTFTGTPAAPTATAGTSTTQLATTAFVTTADNLKAPLASPTFTGTPLAPTATQGTNSTQIATTAYVDTLGATKAPLASPALTGTPTAPTATVGTNTTQIATTAFVLANSTSSSQNLLYVQDQKILGTSGGATVGTNTFQNRDLNAVLINQISGASLTSNQITLPAGTYLLEGYSSCYSVQTYKTQIYNVTDSISISDGDAVTNSASSEVSAGIGAYFTLSSTKTIALRYTSSSAQSLGLGVAFNRGSVEVYSEIKIWKVA